MKHTNGMVAGMIAAGMLAFGFFQDALCRGAASLSVYDLGLLNLVLVTAAGVLVHPDAAHLLVHLGLLSFFGVLLERRQGPGRVSAAVLLGSVLAGLIRLNLLLGQGALRDAAIQVVPHPPMGFSGAAAGLMGLFLVTRAWGPRPKCSRGRHLFRSSPPVLAIGVVLAALFLMRGFSGGPAPAPGVTANIDGWARLAAFAGGLAVGIVTMTADADGDPGRLPAAAAEKQPPGRQVSGVGRYRTV